MENEELKKLLFEAFSVGNYRVNNEVPKVPLAQRFKEWIEKYHPELAEAEVK